MMLRSVNVIFVVALVILLVIAFDPQARKQAGSVWQELKLVMEQLRSELSVLVENITGQDPDLPAEEQQSPPPKDSPVYNA